jgi:hypothetical protein
MTIHVQMVSVILQSIYFAGKKSGYFLKRNYAGKWEVNLGAGLVSRNGHTKPGFFLPTPGGGVLLGPGLPTTHPLLPGSVF